MAETIRFQPPIPDGYAVFENHLKVAGISHRQEAAQQFAQGDQQSLKLEPEPSNQYDRNAIRVIGVWSDSSGEEKSTHLGYIEKDLARLLTRYVPRVLARLRSIFLGDQDGWVGVYFELLGPKEELVEYAIEARKSRAQYSMHVEESPKAKTRKSKVRKADKDEEEMSTLGCVWYLSTLIVAFSVIVALFQAWSLWAAIPAALLVAFIWIRYVGGAD